MAADRSTRSNPCSRNSAERGSAGATLIELLVALTVAGAVLGAALGLSLSSRRGLVADRNRTQINQNLRGALDLLGIEIRQAGERLPEDFPAIELADGGGGAPDRLIVRRNLLDTVLPLCQDLVAGTTDNEIRVADSGGSPPTGCVPVADADANGWPDNIDAWRSYLATQGAAVHAYVYNPVTRVGDWFLFSGDGSTSDHLAMAGSVTWVGNYPVVEQCRVYLLEQRTYDLDNTGTLRFVIDDGAAPPLNVAADLIDLQLQAVMADGTVLDDLDPTGSWADLRSIEVAVAGQRTFDQRTMTRSASARFFPRNVLSN